MRAKRDHKAVRRSWSLFQFLTCLACGLACSAAMQPAGTPQKARADDAVPPVSAKGAVPGQRSSAPEETASLLAPPVNDTCAGALTIPDGPYPVLSAITNGVDMATGTGDPACLNYPPVENGVWYVWKPSVTGAYAIETCAGPTATTDGDGVLAVFTAAGCAGPFTEAGCDDETCHAGVPPFGPGSIGPQVFNALTTYYILASHYPTAQGGGDIITEFQVRISIPPPPPNDTCAGAAPLMLDMPVEGTTLGASDDYHSPNTATCYSGVGQVSSSGTGPDVVYSFTPPAPGSYSFKVTPARVTQLFVPPLDPVLYVASDCLAVPPVATASCLGGANRSQTGSSAGEEVLCLALGAGTVFVYVDDASGTNIGNDFILEVTRCTRESESNGGPPPTPVNALACGIEGTISPGSDVDFYALGTPAASSRIFAIADGGSSNSSGFDMRITTSTTTLEYDDDNNDFRYGSLSPNCAGTPSPTSAVPLFIRMNHSSGTASEPYRLFSVVQPPLASATLESEPNQNLANFNSATNAYFRGVVPTSGPGDYDAFAFCADKGDLIFLGLDADPLRNNTPFNGEVDLYDGSLSNLTFAADAAAASSTTPGPSLTSTTPFSPAESLTWKAEYSGLYIAGVFSTSVVGGDYLLSISTNCLTGTQRSSDLSAAKTDGPDPVDPGSDITYIVTVTNAGPNTAQNATMNDSTPANTTFRSLTAPPGWSCTTPPVGGTGAIACSVACLPPGVYNFTIVVRVGAGTPNGTVINNQATTGSITPDPNPANNTASASTTVRTLPAAGRDCFDSWVTLKVTLFPPYGPAGGGCMETLMLPGPFKVLRGNPFDPGDGRDTVNTLMACYRFQANSAPGACGLGPVLAHPSPDFASTGQIRSIAPAQMLPADSFFDVFVSLETGGGAFHTSSSTHMTAVINSVPPGDGQIYLGPGAAIPLFNSANIQVGTIEVIQHEIHHQISCPCECEPAIVYRPNKVTLDVGIPQGGGGVQYDVAHGTTVGGPAGWLLPGDGFATAGCLSPNGPATVTDPLPHAPAGKLRWFVSRDGALGQYNGTYNSCWPYSPLPNRQVGNRGLEIPPVCP